MGVKGSLLDIYVYLFIGSIADLLNRSLRIFLRAELLDEVMLVDLPFHEDGDEEKEEMGAKNEE